MVESHRKLTLSKVVAIGAEKTGKTSLIRAFTNLGFEEDYRPTIGVEFMTTSRTIQDTNVKLQVWDTAGQEKYTAILTAYLRGSDCFLFIYDVANRHSFDFIQAKWKQATDTQPDAKVFVIGNKADLKESREVSTAEGRDLADQLSADAFMEVSCKTNEGFEEVMDIVFQFAFESG